jgi:dephospho-CoA kinase
MRLIALTGSICSGKSTVLRFFKQQGIAAIDCDVIVSELHKRKAVQKKLLREFGTFNKNKISAIIFPSPRKRKKLEGILHPLVWKEIKKNLKRLKRQGKRFAVVDVPLLFEAKWQNRFDAVIVVKAGKRQCMQRALKKGIKRKLFLLRYAAQTPIGKKIKRAHYIIDNGGSVAKTRKQARQLAAKLKGLLHE